VPENAPYEEIRPEEVEGWRSRGARIVDVREPEEYAEGHIPGAESVPLGEVLSGSLQGEPDGPLVLVCASGNRSGTAAQHLAGLGAREIANLEGGTLAWSRCGLPLE
jgi:phage shock protein E